MSESASSPEHARESVAGRTRELALSAAWHGGLARSLSTSSGELLAVVYRGNWSHGYGPDFVDAMIRFGDGKLQTGAVEIHHRASDWRRHGHHLDPRYNTVVLHVVSQLDVEETRRADGAIVPTAVLDVPSRILLAIDRNLPGIWDQLGGSVCAGDLARHEPDRIRAVLNRLGDRRFGDRVDRFEGELTVSDPETELTRGIFDGFGYAENREAMARLFHALGESGGITRIVCAAPAERWRVTAGLLFGLGGFLPFSPTEAVISRLDPVVVRGVEESWRGARSWYAAWTIPANLWARGRSRPANHPVSRLVALTNLLANAQGELFSLCLERIHSDGKVEQTLKTLSSSSAHPGIGLPRAIATTANVVLPLSMAWARYTGDDVLEDAVSRSWARLPRSEWSRPTRRGLAQVAGETPITGLAERAIQGLLMLDRDLCTPRRCYECPIAAEVVRDLQREIARGSVPDLIQLDVNANPTD